jgi:hypothetical protein
MAGSFTIIDFDTPHLLPATIDGDGVRVPAAALASALGWELKPQGFCKDDACYPVPPRSTIVGEHGVDLGAFASLIGRPAAVDSGEGAAYLGAPAAERAARLASLEAPDFTLPDLDGRMHSLSDYRGRKVLLAAYGSW